MTTRAGLDAAPRQSRRSSTVVAGKPALAAVSLAAQGDGVAYVARLLNLAVAELWSAPVVLELAPRSAGEPTILERASFLARATKAQVFECDWVVFAHLGLARVQTRIPACLRRPYSVFLHGIEVWNRDLQADRLLALRRARLRVANSAYTARRVVAMHPDIGPVAACPLALHPNDTGLQHGAPSATVLGRVGPRSVVIVGRMNAAERYKGHDELIECWSSVLEQIPDAQLVVVGVGNDRDRLMQKAAAAQLGESVVFTGYVDDATRNALLSRAALFAMPSRGEGFGIVYLQAMRAGTACLGSRLDAAGDVIVDGETGRLVDPADRGELAAAIISLLSDESLRRRMGEAGRRRYELEFTFDRFRDRLGGLLAEAFGATPEAN